jgi:hypothetical protein
VFGDLPLQPSLPIMSHDDNLAEFVGITSCDPELARVFMEKCFWNVEMAVSQYFENPGRYTAADLKAIDVDDDVRAPIEPKRQVLQDQMDDDDGVVYEVVQRGRPRVSRSRTSMEAFRSFNDEQRYLRESALLFRAIFTETPRHLRGNRPTFYFCHPKQAILYKSFTIVVLSIFHSWKKNLVAEFPHTSTQPLFCIL